MRSVGHWQRVFRAWAALTLATAHLLLMLSSSVTQAASFSITPDVNGVICLPSGSGAPELPSQPVHDHRGDCCVLCAAPGPVAVPAPAVDVVLIYAIAASSVDGRYVAPAHCDFIGSLPGSPRAPPDIA